MLTTNLKTEFTELSSELESYADSFMSSRFSRGEFDDG